MNLNELLALKPITIDPVMMAGLVLLWRLDKRLSRLELAYQELQFLLKGKDHVLAHR